MRIDGLALVEDSEGPGRFRGRARAAQGLPLRPAHDVHVLADRDRVGPWGVFGGHDGRSPSTSSIRDGVGDAARLEDDARARAGRRDQRAHVRRRRLRPARGARPGARAARRAGGEGQRRARARRLPRRGRDGAVDELRRRRCARDRYLARSEPWSTGFSPLGTHLRRDERALLASHCDASARSRRGWGFKRRARLAEASARERPDRGRHRRHVHGRDARSTRTPAASRSRRSCRRRPIPSAGFMQAVERALAEGDARRRAGQLRRPRDDRRDERDHRGQDRAQRLRHDRRLPRPARDRAPGAAFALRHAVREGAAARAARPRRRRRERLGPRARC